MLKGKKIVLGVTGSIAAYKSAHLVRLLVKQDAQVRVVMTAAAEGFISPLTLSTLSGTRVQSELVREEVWNNHVRLGRWADLLLIAPASANTLSKMAAGVCDNLLTAVFLSSSCPVVFAPAMDEDMWLHSAVQSNVRLLGSRGNYILPVGEGELASGLVGEGRMAEPEEILEWLEHYFSAAGRPLEGRTALVTAGPTHEPLDPVRFLGNRSSGRMGISVAEALVSAGATVRLVLGPTHLGTRAPGIAVTRVETAKEMRDACMENAANTDILVMAAAVADYRPGSVSPEKIRKSSGPLRLELEKTPDILAEMGREKRPGQILVGFSLETDHETDNALRKLREKNLDLIVLNSLKEAGAGFGGTTNKVTIFGKEGSETRYPLKSKSAVAADIVKAIIDLYHVREAS